jgi:hypothetical protein
MAISLERAIFSAVTPPKVSRLRFDQAVSAGGRLPIQLK